MKFRDTPVSASADHTKSGLRLANDRVEADLGRMPHLDLRRSRGALVVPALRTPCASPIDRPPHGGLLDGNAACASSTANFAGAAAGHGPEAVELSSNEDSGQRYLELDAAVMFTDIVGFTGWSERHTPFQALHLLRRVYMRLEGNVYRYGGRVGKYIGDGVMATFGTPEIGPRGAADALFCLMAIVNEFADWNFRRAQRGCEPIRISVGLHYGPVIFGNLGEAPTSEVAVLGDTVNIANRLETLTREIGCVATVSVPAAEAASRVPRDGTTEMLALFRYAGDRHLKGRSKTVEVLAYGSPPQWPVDRRMSA